MSHVAAISPSAPIAAPVVVDKATPWWMWIVLAYAGLVPVVATVLPGLGGTGAADFLFPFGLAIVIPLYFSLFVPVNQQVVKRTLKAFGIGGGVAVAVGLILYILQIEIREEQQKLWVDGGFSFRAGGIIGNSGAFGHQTATWCLVTIGSLLTLSRSKYRRVAAVLVFFMSAYAIYGGSSRTAIMHLIVGTSLFVVIRPFRRKTRSNFAVLGVAGICGVALLVCLAQLPKSKATGGTRDAAVQAQLERLIPGLGGSSSNFTSNRLDNWPEYIEMISHSVWLGTGYKTGVLLHEESPDNSYLSVMLETGLFGFLCMGMFVLSVLYRSILLYFQGLPHAVILIPLCAGQLINCATSDIYTFWVTMPVVYLIIGFVLQLHPEKGLTDANPAICG